MKGGAMSVPCEPLHCESQCREVSTRVAKKLDNTMLVVVWFGTEEKQTITRCNLLTTMDM